jgi:cytochrome P450
MTTAAESQLLLLQLLNESNRADPYPLYQRIRNRGVLKLPDLSLVVLSSFHACDDALRHPSSVSDRTKSTVGQRQMAAGVDPRSPIQPGFLFLDPPDHTRLRKLVSKAFAPKVVKALEPEITALVDSLLDSIEERGRFDVVEDLAHPLPVAVICRLLGVPVEDAPQFSRASALLAQALDPFITITGQAADGADERLAASRWLREYVRDLIRQRRSHPGEDLMSELIRVEESGDQLTEEEIISTCNLLLVAGHETTVNLLGNAILALLRDPKQWAALGTDPQRAPAVVEEALRYDPPVQILGRIAAEDMTIDGTPVAKGEIMMLLLAAANRDPELFDRPDEFDPDRDEIRHLAFGKGPHFCLGAPLARLESALALSAVAARFPNARLASEPKYKKNLNLRGLESLSVAV